MATLVERQAGGRTLYLWHGSYHDFCDHADRVRVAMTFDRSGVVCGTAKAWWTEDAGKASELAEFAPEGPLRDRLLTLRAAREQLVELSRAHEAEDFDVPCPAGLEYMPFQVAGIRFAWLAWEQRGLATVQQARGEAPHLELTRPGKLAVGIWDQMGLGKTIQLIGFLNLLVERGELGRDARVLIVVPASLKRNWLREIEKWCLPVQDGTWTAAVEGREWPVTNIVVTNYEALQKHRKVHLSWLDGRGAPDPLFNQVWDIEAGDEAHYILNEGAQRTKNFHSVPRRFWVSLTGTPLRNRPAELWPTLHHMDPVEWPLTAKWRFYRRYCCPPEAPMWMADGTFKPLGEVREGDEVMGWLPGEGPNSNGDPRAGSQKLCPAKVLAVHRKRDSLVKVTMASGRVIRCTPDHLWKTYHRKAEYPWVRVKPGRTLCHVVDVPEPLPAEKQWLAGWLAGIYDGEGSGERIAQYAAANPETYPAIGAALDALGLPYSEGKTGEHYYLTGGRQTMVNFLNWCRPVKTRVLLERRVRLSRFITPDRVVSVEPDGEGEVLGLTTSTGNYVVWGYASKNCGASQENGFDRSGASNLGELQDRVLRLLAVRRTKTQVLTELPPKRRQVVEIDDPAAMRLVQDEMDAWRAQEERLSDLQVAVELAKAGEDEEAYNEAVARLREAVGIAFAEIARVRHLTTLAKVPHCIRFIEGVLEQGEKCIFFAHHIDVLELVIEHFRDKTVVIHGGVPLECGPAHAKRYPRQEAMDRFNLDPTVRLAVLGITAAGVGLTMLGSPDDPCSTVVFGELDWVPANVSQAEDRNHRIGQGLPVNVYHLVFNDSLDARMAKVLVAKQAISDAALDDRPELERVPVVPSEAADTGSRRQLDRDADAMTDAQREAVLAALRVLAAYDPDSARELNGVGFNKLDTRIGKELAANETLTPRQAALGRRIARKYHRQLAPGLLAAMGVPPTGRGPQAQEAEEQAPEPEVAPLPTPAPERPVSRPLVRPAAGPVMQPTLFDPFGDD